MRCCSVLSTVLMQYIFETRAMERLALTDLNLVVISFKDETDKHNAMMTEIWQSVLKRTPCEKEMSIQSDVQRECVRSECLRESTRKLTGVQRCSQDQGRGVVPTCLYTRYTMWSLPFDDSDIINRTLEDVIQSVCGET
jgi:hypothetical protein